MPITQLREPPSKIDQLAQLLAMGLGGYTQGRELKRRRGLEEREMTLREKVGGRERLLKRKKWIRGKDYWWLVDEVTGEMKKTEVPVLFGQGMGEGAGAKVPEEGGLSNVFNQSLQWLEPEAKKEQAAKKPNLRGALSKIGMSGPLRSGVETGIGSLANVLSKVKPKPKATPKGETGRVTVISPTGQEGTIPRRQLAAAQKAGYKLVTK